MTRASGGTWPPKKSRYIRTHFLWPPDKSREHYTLFVLIPTTVVRPTYRTLPPANLQRVLISYSKNGGKHLTFYFFYYLWRLLRTPSTRWRPRPLLVGCYCSQCICNTFWNFWKFYNPLDGALGLLLVSWVVVVAARVTNSLSPWSYKVCVHPRH